MSRVKTDLTDSVNDLGVLLARCVYICLPALVLQIWGGNTQDGVQYLYNAPGHHSCRLNQ